MRYSPGSRDAAGWRAFSKAASSSTPRTAASTNSSRSTCRATSSRTSPSEPPPLTRTPCTATDSPAASTGWKWGSRGNRSLEKELFRLSSSPYSVVMSGFELGDLSTYFFKSMSTFICGRYNYSDSDIHLKSVNVPIKNSNPAASIRRWSKSHPRL